MADAAEVRSVRRAVQASMDRLSASERKVARALLAAYPAVALTTVSDLAAAAGVSAPTVVRFATRIGYSGFPALQKALLHEIDEGFGSPLVKYAARGAGDGALAHTAGTFQAALAATFDEVPESEFQALARLLADESRAVRVVGGRFSRLAADCLVTHLTMMRSHVQLVPRDEVPRLAAIADAGQSTVLVAYDYRRYTDATVQFAADIHARGATIALFTDTWLSPIAKFADVVLPARVESPSPWDSLVPAFALTEALVAAVTTELADRGRSRLEVIEGTRTAGTDDQARAPGWP